MRILQQRIAILLTGFLIVCSLFGQPCIGQECPAAIEEHSITIETLLAKASSVLDEPLLATPDISGEKVSFSLDPADQDSFMRMLDLLPGYEWVEGVSEDGAKFHVLSPDWGERALWEHIEFSERMSRGRSKIAASRLRLEEYMRALALTPEELRALEYEDPWLVWTLSHDNTRALIAYLAQLPEETVGKIFKGGLAIPFSELPFDMQVEMAVWTRYEADLGYWKPPFDVEVTEEVLLAAGKLAFGYGVEGIETMVSFPGLPQAQPGAGGFGEFLTRPRGLYVEDGRMRLRMERGMPREEAEKLLDGEMLEFAERLKRERMQNLAAKPPRFGGGEFPRLLLDHKLEGKRTYATLHDLCEGANLPLVAHYFDKYDHPLYARKRFVPGMPLAVAIDRVADEMGSVWAFADGAVILTSRELIKDLQQEIPELVLAKWRKRIQLRQGKLTLDDLGDLATEIDPHRLAGIPRDLRQAGAGLIIAQRIHLLFFGSLDKAQREQARKGAKVSFDSLTSSQKRLFERAASFGSQQPRLRATSDSYFQITTHDPWIEFNYGLSDAPAQTFPLPVLAVHLAKSQDERVISGDSPTTQSEAEQDEGRSPEQIAAVALAHWSFVGRVALDNEQLAILETRSGGAVKSRILQKGDSLERASLVSIGPDHLVFQVGQAKLTLSISRAVSLPPWQGNFNVSSAR